MLLAAVLMLFAAALAEGDVLILPSDTKVIEAEAFANNASLKKVVLPEGITEIQSKAFSGCRLTEINLPESLKTIASDAFEGCESAEFTVIKDSAAHIWAVNKGYNALTMEDLGFFFEISENTSILSKCTSSETVITVPESYRGYPVTVIGEYAFSYRSNAEKILLPEGITTIGQGAFQECSALSEIEIPAGVKRLPGTAFRNCRALKKITLHQGLESIGYMCFDNCWQLSEITLPKGFIEIGTSAFNSCSSLEKLSLPGSLTTIGGSAFRSCISLKSLKIPAAVSSIGADAFATHGGKIIISVARQSYAQQYCASNGIPYKTY